MGLPPGSRITVLAPVVVNRKGEHRQAPGASAPGGLQPHPGERRDLGPGRVAAPWTRTSRNTIEAVVDRLVIKARPGAPPHRLPGVGPEAGRRHWCGSAWPGRRGTALLRDASPATTAASACRRLTPRLFSFNSPQGACPACSGLGTRLIIDPDLVVPNPGLSLREGAVRPWAQRHSLRHQQMLEALEKHLPFLDPHAFPGSAAGGPGRHPVRLQGRAHQILSMSTAAAASMRPSPSPASSPCSRSATRRPTPAYVRDEIEQYMGVRPCPDCGGARLRKEALAVKHRRGQHQRSDRLHRGPGPATGSPA